MGNNIKLIIGLGNKGSEYDNTPHNAGFDMIDTIIAKHDMDYTGNIDDIRSKTHNHMQNKFNGLYLRSSIGSHNVIYLKPQTYMNLSGESAVKFKNYFKIENKNIIVIHDDIDLGLSIIKYKFAGNNAGHNGLKSLDSNITNGYHRLRIGVGRPDHPEIPISDYVLNQFSTEKYDILHSVISKTAYNFLDIIENRFSETSKS